MTDQHRRFRPAARVGSGVGYIGDGNYSSGDYGSDAPNDYDYDYAGFKGDAGIDEYGDNQYGGGRYGQGPFEQSQQYGGNDFGSGRGPYGALQRQFDNLPLSGRRRVSDSSQGGRGYSGFSEDQVQGFAPGEFSGASDWRSAPDIADPAGYQVFHVRDDAPRRLGRGPKGYRRSDERILEDIYEHLLSTHHLDTSDVRIEVHDGTATLTGTVPERRMKHAIEDLIHGLRDVREIENRLRVPAQRGERQS